MSAERYVGQRVARSEDERFLRGRGSYVADMRLPGMKEAAILRSTVAHARLLSVATEDAQRLPGVRAVFTAKDLEGRVAPFTRPFYAHIAPSLIGRYQIHTTPYRAQVLAESEVFRTGEPIAVVVADTRAIAEDALELIEVDYDDLPVISSAEEGLRPGAPQLHPEVPGNVACRFQIDAGDADAAFAAAARTWSGRFVTHRSIGSPMETRGVLGEYSRGLGRLTLWTAQQRPHLLRTYLSEMLDLPEEKVRVVAPDMGGSFGGGIYNEEVLIAFAAMELGVPVSWIEDRAENYGNARHSRDQVHEVSIAFGDDGRITGLRDAFTVDTGAYNPFTITLPFNSATHLRGQNDIPNVSIRATSVLTNKQQTTPVRGAGRPEVAFVMDRLLEIVADETGIDPAEVRRRNLIRADAMPRDMGMLYRDGSPLVYDSGDYPAQLEMALDAIGYDDFRRQQPGLLAAGRMVGIGISSHVEGSGYGPYEGAIVRVDRTGHVVVVSGSNPHGQSHETVLAQVCADELGVDIAGISVVSGDTDAIPYGGGTFASRSAVTAGSAVSMAARKLRRKVMRVAGDLLGIPAGELTMEAGRVIARGEAALTLAEVAQAAEPGMRWTPGPDDIAGLEERGYYVPPSVTWSSATHIAIVEVDPQTGFVDILRYVVVDECGNQLNPMVVDGQQHGGVAHGVGNTLYEEAVYDAQGQFVTGTMMDYLLPTSAEVPDIEVHHQVCPTPLNPIGVKGCGEGGCVSPPGAIANAVADALRPLRVQISEIPITPERLVLAIERARLARGSGQEAGSAR